MDWSGTEDEVRRIRELGETDGKLDSPIDLNIGHAVRVWLDRPLSWSRYDVPPKKVKLINTGETVALLGRWQNEQPFLSGGPLAGKYLFSQVHFHWGRTEMDGSEHSFDGAGSPMELHAVHFNSTHENQETAMRRTDGIVVLVYAFKLRSSANAAIQRIIDKLPDLRKPQSTSDLEPEALTNLIRPFREDYLVYWGSVLIEQYRSAPVLWIVGRAPIPISIEQVAEFRKILSKKCKPLLNNCRKPRHPVGERKVFHINPSGMSYATLMPISREVAPPAAGPGPAAAPEGPSTPPSVT